MAKPNMFGASFNLRVERAYTLWEELERRGERASPAYVETVRNLIHLLYMYYRNHEEKKLNPYSGYYCTLFPETDFITLHNTLAESEEEGDSE